VAKVVRHGAVYNVFYIFSELSEVTL